ncbi:MAG: SpoIID/LytB domain-containing protein [Candidatus Gastranaerophilales bacterium]|nr:SpoIID/LytB domain-containing protein [Candidatus Gastranaerophilales bacterium]
MKLKLLLVLFLGLFIIQKPILAQEKQVVRVAISNQNFSTYEHQSVKLSSDDFIKIIDMSQKNQIDPVDANKIIEIRMENSLFNIYIDGDLKYENLNGPLLFGSNKELQILELNRKGTPAKYFGMLELRHSKNNIFFNIINVIDMQNYLRGVVSNEMPISFGLEALKAQSVAARNYVQNAQINQNYDVVDSTASQVYYGVNSYKDVADMAVYQTKGIYALYDEKPITALYFSTSTGITDDWEDIFGTGVYSGKYPYLKARYDLDNEPLKSERDVEKFLSQKDNGLDINSPKFRWEFEFDRGELEEVLHYTLQQQSKLGYVSPNYDGDIKIEGLKEIIAIKRTPAGKITELEIKSKTGNYKIKTQLAIRRVLKKNNAMMPSTAFFVIASKKEEALLNEGSDAGLLNIFDSEAEGRYPKTFKVVGGGFGHGVGMSQYGASALAKVGKRYPEILKHYYTDIKISTIPKIVEANEYNMGSKVEFYFEPEVYKEAYLYINNTRGVKEFPFKINDIEFSETAHIANKKVVKINITEYLRQGINIIDFPPLSYDNKGKHIIYRVEFENE